MKCLKIKIKIYTFCMCMCGLVSRLKRKTQTEGIVNGGRTRIFGNGKTEVVRR